MTHVPLPELATIFARPPRPVASAVESVVRDAAAVLCHATPDLIKSTTVVVTIGPDDLDALEHLVRDVVDAHALEAEVRPRVGSCAIRFWRTQ